MSEHAFHMPFRAFQGSFPDRLTPGFFLDRSDIFTDIVARTHDHFWDPNDSAYIDFDVPFDMSGRSIMPLEMVPEMRSGIAQKLTPQQRISFANDSAHWWLSGFLHGEQGALYLAVSLCESLRDPNAIEYATNQAREEARHVSAFTRYIQSRWGAPLPVNPVFGALLTDIVTAQQIHRKLIGMQVLVEGLAMGFMAQLYQKANDPVLVRLAQLVMTDETFHHRMGKLWTQYGLPELCEEDRNDAEDFALECFQSLVFKVFNPEQKQDLYQKYGLATDEVRAELQNIYADQARRDEMANSYSVFRLLVRTLVGSGIVTERTRGDYGRWVDLDTLGTEADHPVEDVITAEGLAFLKTVNAKRKHRHKPAQPTPMHPTA